MKKQVMSIFIIFLRCFAAFGCCYVVGAAFGSFMRPDVQSLVLEDVRDHLIMNITSSAWAFVVFGFMGVDLLFGLFMDFVRWLKQRKDPPAVKQ